MASRMIQLLHFNLARLRVEQDLLSPADADVEGGQAIGYDILTPDGEDEEATNRFLLSLTVSGTTPAAKGEPVMSYDVRANAVFETPKDLPADGKRALVALNGGMILYGLVRGQVGLVTGSFPGGCFLLPAVDWQAAVMEIEKNRVGTRASAPPAKPPAPKTKESRPSRAIRKSATETTGKAVPGKTAARKPKK